MAEITICLSDLEWTSDRGAHTVGKAFLDDELLESPDLNRSFRSASSYAEFRSLVSSLNGQFAVIVTTGNEIWAGVDHIRTHPLFYAVFDEEIYVGDDFPAIDDAIEFKSPDRVSAMEFVAAGYPSGTHTLHPDVDKMCAGEVLRIETTGRTTTVETEEYFRYRQNPDPIDDEEELLELMDEALTNAFERTIEVLDGRKVLLPLTGGYDSRLIGLMLRDQGYENVHTFCHNLEGEVDLEISRRVASDLDYSWQEMRHTQEELDRVRQSEEWLRLREDIGGFGSLHPSSRHLSTFDKATREFDRHADFVLLRGDTAAAPGGFMPEFFGSTAVSKERTAINTIFDYHYNQCLWNRRKHSNRFQNRISESIPHTNIDSKDKVIDLIEYWYWRERTPNILLPHPLVLHQNQISGWFPLWDKEFAKAMSFIPFQYRLDKILYKNYMREKYKNFTGYWRDADRERKQGSTVQAIEHTFGKYFIGSLLENPLRLARNKARLLFSEYNCELELSGGSELNISEINSANEIAHWILRNRQEEPTQSPNDRI